MIVIDKKALDIYLLWKVSLSLSLPLSLPLSLYRKEIYRGEEKGRWGKGREAG